METHDAFKKREQALENAYFAAHDAKLLERLRSRATLGEVVIALKEKLKVDDAELLQEIRDLGINPETGAALLLAPLVQVAWIDGGVTADERKTVIRLAAARGVEAGSPAHGKLVEWLEHRPPDHLFDTAMKTIEAGLSVLPPEERAQRESRVADSCRHVAMASGGIAAAFGLGGEVSDEERQLLESISERLHHKGQPES